MDLLFKPFYERSEGNLCKRGFDSLHPLSPARSSRATARQAPLSPSSYVCATKRAKASRRSPADRDIGGLIGDALWLHPRTDLYAGTARQGPLSPSSYVCAIKRAKASRRSPADRDLGGLLIGDALRLHPRTDLYVGTARQAPPFAKLLRVCYQKGESVAPKSR